MRRQAAVLDLVETERVAAVLGGGSSSISILAQLVLQQARIPQVAYTSTSPLLSDDTKYPTFSRVVSPDTRQGPALAKLCLSQGWSSVGVISTTDEYATEVRIPTSAPHYIPPSSSPDSFPLSVTPDA